MARSIVTLARTVANLSAEEYAHFKEWVRFMQSLPGTSTAKKGELKKGKKKRKYTRKAVPEAAAEVKGKKKRSFDETFPNVEKA